MKYNVEIKETLSRIISIDSSSAIAARRFAEESYRNEELVLNSDDYVSTEFDVIDDTITRCKNLYPYFKSGDNDFSIIQGDCVETLSKFEYCFDMIFADPPYFLSDGGISCKNGRIVCVDKGDWDKPTTIEDMDSFNFRWLSACRDHMKDNATIWISGTYHNIFSVQQQLQKLGFKILNVIVWSKTNPPPNISCRFFTYSTEFIIWARKSSRVAHYYNYDLMKKLNDGKQMTDVWRLPAIAKWEKSCGKHPTQKPLSLLARIIQASTMPGACVLDPFCGSSTTGIAANLLNRNFLGLEIEADFLALSKLRRLDIDNLEVRQDYMKRLLNAKIVPESACVCPIPKFRCIRDDFPW